jgi:hypothetical protein
MASTTATLIAYLIFTERILTCPHLYRVGHAFFYIFMGSCLLLTKKTFYKNQFQLTDWAFFLPAILYIIDFSHFFVQSAAIKKAMIVYDLVHHEITHFKKGLFLSPEGHFYLRVFTVFFISVYQTLLMFNLLKRHGKDFFIANKQLFLCHLGYALLMGITIMPLIFTITIDLTPKMKTLYVIINALLVLVSFPVFLLFCPKILYGSAYFEVRKVKQY